MKQEQQYQDGNGQQYRLLVSPQGQIEAIEVTKVGDALKAGFRSPVVDNDGLVDIPFGQPIHQVLFDTDDYDLDDIIDTLEWEDFNGYAVERVGKAIKITGDGQAVTLCEALTATQIEQAIKKAEPGESESLFAVLAGLNEGQKKSGLS